MSPAASAHAPRPGPPPPPPTRQVVWRPTPPHIAESNLTTFTAYINRTYNAAIRIGDYDALHTWSVRHAAAFWTATATHLRFPLHPAPQPHNAIRRSTPASTDGRSARRPARPALVDVDWFPGSTTNVATAMLAHADHAPRAPAVVALPESADPARASSRSLSFATLRSQVAVLSAALRRTGVRRGTSVAAVLPTGIPVLQAMLATAACGAVWSCCPPDFGHHALLARLSQTAPQVLFFTPGYVSGGVLHYISQAIARLVADVPSIRYLVSVDVFGAPPRFAPPITAGLRPGCRHMSFAQFIAHIPQDVPFAVEPMQMSDPVVTMFTSGTTGPPKCIVQGSGIVLNQMKEHVLHHEVGPASTVFVYTSSGWMMFNWLAAALACGACIVLYDGAPFPPDDPMRLHRIISKQRVSHFCCGAKILHIMAKRLASTQAPPIPPTPVLRMAIGTGSPSTELHFRFVARAFGPHVQYVTMSGGTEINGCFVLGSPWKPVRVGEAQCAALGMDVRVCDDDGRPVVAQPGELVCYNAAPCMPLCFSKDPSHAKFRASYFDRFGEHVWCHGDYAEQSALGGFVISGRSDGTINPGGIRIGTADLYEVVENLAFVRNSIVAERFVADANSHVFMFLVLSPGAKLDESAEGNIRKALRTMLSSHHVPRVLLQVDDIPFTYSGKKCEIALKRLLNGQAVNLIGIHNPQAFESIRRALQEHDSAAKPERPGRVSKL